MDHYWFAGQSGTEASRVGVPSRTRFLGQVAVILDQPASLPFAY